MRKVGKIDKWIMREWGMQERKTDGQMDNEGMGKVGKIARWINGYFLMREGMEE